MVTVVLVHGAWHGSWAWDAVRAECTARGLDSVAVELPITDPAATLADYVASVRAGFPADGDIVLVSHSMGGLVAPLVASDARVAGAVYVAPLIPVPGVSALEMSRSSQPPTRTEFFRNVKQIVHGDGSTSVPTEIAGELFYADCAPADAAAAVRRLRPQHWAHYGEPSPLVGWPQAPGGFLAYTEDRVLTVEGIEAGAAGRPVRVRRGGHSPMLADPRGLLADVLDLIE